MTEWLDPPTVAASLSAVAAIAAAIATWRGPLSAARMAETLRHAHETANEARRAKLHVFANIMQSRAEIYHEDSVRALNLVDVVFSKCIPVREAWAELYQALNLGPGHDSLIEERTRKLLKAMAMEIGLADDLRLDNFARIYFPTAIAQERQWRQLERQSAIARLTGGNRTAENAASDLWPPRPSPL